MSVSDRRVTVDSTVHDDAFNKAIVCIVDDCAITITFTGIAYLDGLPTDEWIARAILGARYKSSITASANKGRVGPTQLSQIQKRIVVALRLELGRVTGQLRHSDLEIHLAGLRAVHGVQAAFGLVVRKSTFDAEFTFRIFNRFPTPDWTRSFVFASGGWDLVERDTMRWLHSSLASPRFPKNSRPDEYVAGRLLEALRRFADRHESIGSEALTIRHAPMLWETFVSFNTLRASAEPAMGGILEGHWRPSYTPWLIGVGTYYAPMKFVGSSTVCFAFSSPGSNRRETHKIHFKGHEQPPGLPEMFFIGRAPRELPPSASRGRQTSLKPQT